MGRHNKAYPQRQLAKDLGVAPSQIIEWKNKGMPVNSLAAARLWIDQNIHNSKTLENPPAQTAVTPEHSDTLRDLLKRSKDAEKRAYDAMTQAEDADPATYNQALKAYTNLQRNRIDAERAVIDLAASENLIPSEVAGEATRQIVAVIVSQLEGWPKALAHRCNRKNPDVAQIAIESALKQLMTSVKKRVEPMIVETFEAASKNF